MWLFLIACQAHIPEVAPLPPAADVDVDAPSHGGLVLQGFDATWQARPHRLRRVEFGATGAAGRGGLGGELTIELRGGTWADGERAYDVADSYLDYAAVLGSDLVYVPGRADLVLAGSLDADGRTSASGVVAAAIPLDRFDPDDALAVWITGFTLEAGPAHPHGYTVHALSVGLSEPVWVDGTVQFEVSGRLDAGRVLDRPQDLDAYGAVIRVDYAVIATPGHAERFTIAAGDGTGAPDRDGMFRTPVALDLPSGLPIGVTGLSSFDIELLADGMTDGRYVRGLTIALADEHYDGERGRYEAIALTRFANDGPIARPARVRQEATWTLLQLADGEVRTGRFAPPTPGQHHQAAYPSLEAPLEIAGARR